LWQKFGKRGRSEHGTAPARSQGLTTFLNRWVMIPDKCFPWIGPATRFARDLKFDAIYSTSDPLSDHLVARRVSQHTGAPFVAEFRDLWLGSPYFARAHPTALHSGVARPAGAAGRHKASVVVGLSRGISDYFAKTYTKPVRTIYNCFDPEEYPTPTRPPVGSLFSLCGRAVQLAFARTVYWPGSRSL